MSGELRESEPNGQPLEPGTRVIIMTTCGPRECVIHEGPLPFLAHLGDWYYVRDPYSPTIVAPRRHRRRRPNDEPEPEDLMTFVVGIHSRDSLKTI